MIELIHKPENVTLKGNRYSILSEIQGLPIKIIDEDYYGFRVRNPLLDPLAGGIVHIILDNDEYWTFKVTGIDVSTINELKDAQIRLYNAIPDNLRCHFQFQWKSFLNSQGLTRYYSLVTYDYIPYLYTLLKTMDVRVMADDGLKVPYFRISTK